MKLNCRIVDSYTHEPIPQDRELTPGTYYCRFDVSLNLETQEEEIDVTIEVEY